MAVVVASSLAVNGQQLIANPLGGGDPNLTLADLGNMGELLTENQIGKPGYEGHLNVRPRSTPS